MSWQARWLWLDALAVANRSAQFDGRRRRVYQCSPQRCGYSGRGWHVEVAG